MSTDEAEQAPARIVLDFDLDTGDLEDIEEYTGLGNVLDLVANAVDGVPPDRQVQALLKNLPTKVVSAVLGAARRRADPTWTMDRWRQFKISDIPSANGDGSGPDPTRPAASPRTGGASPNGSQTSEPAPISATTG